jgi:hypothetical protein
MIGLVGQVRLAGWASVPDPLDKAYPPYLPHAPQFM